MSTGAMTALLRPGEEICISENQFHKILNKGTAAFYMTMQSAAVPYVFPLFFCYSL